MENLEILKTECLELLSEGKHRRVIELMITLQPADIATVLENEDLNAQERSIIFRLLPKDIAAEAFVFLDTDMQEALIKSFTDNELKSLLSQMFADDTVDIIEEMPANVVKRIIKSCPASQRQDINGLLAFDKESAGSIMTPEYISLKLKMTVEEAFHYIRKEGLDSETVYTCYVTDKQRHLIGVVTVRELLLADRNAYVEDVMNPNVISVNTSTEREEAAKILEKYDFLAVPVVDKEARLVGIITVDDALDVLLEETHEDFSKMAAVVPTQEGYFKTSVLKHSMLRIVWLIILMISATVTGFIITYYEEAFASVPLLIACLPMLMGTGGNCGSQASTMVIRALATDEMKPRQIIKVLWKELRIALTVGIVLVIVNTVRLFVIYGFGHEVLLLAITNALALIFTVCLAQSLGCLLPMGAKAIKLDPAIMASPLITTIVDALSVLVFFMCAVWVFRM